MIKLENNFNPAKPFTKIQCEGCGYKATAKSTYTIETSYSGTHELWGPILCFNCCSDLLNLLKETLEN